MAIFNSYVSSPEGTQKNVRKDEDRTIKMIFGSIMI